MGTRYTAQQPISDYGLQFATILYSASLAASTDTTLTIPGAYARYKAVIKCSRTTGTLNSEVWVALNATAAAPAGASFATTTSELLTEEFIMCHEVTQGDVLHFFAPVAATDVSVALYTYGVNG